MQALNSAAEHITKELTLGSPITPAGPSENLATLSAILERKSSKAPDCRAATKDWGWPWDACPLESLIIMSWLGLSRP